MSNQQLDNYGVAGQQAGTDGAAGYAGYDGPRTQPDTETGTQVDGPRARAYDGPPPREGRYRPPAWVRVIGTLLIVCMAVLLACGVGTGALALLAYTTPALSATSSQTFAVAGTPTVIVQGEAGNVNIVTGSANQVAVRITKHARSITTGIAQQALDAMRITATQSGDTITITEQVPPFTVSPPFLARDFQLDLSVPETTNVSATLNAGNLTDDSVQGTLSVDANAGTVVIRGAQISDANLHANAGTMLLQGVTLSGSASLIANSGSIDLDGTLAPHTSLNVAVNSGSASLTLPAATSAHLDASARVGDINIVGWPISVNRNVTQASASGDLAPNPTGTIVIRADVGDVSLTAR